MKMFRLLLIVAFATGPPRICNSAVEESQALEEVHRTAAMMVQRRTTHFRDQLLPTLTESEAAVVKHIVFDDPSSSPIEGWEIPSAYISKKDKTRHVRLSAGFGSIMLELSAAATLQQWNPSFVFSDYVRYLGESIGENRELIRKKRPLKRAQSSLSFFKVSPEQWDSIMEQQWFKDHLLGFMYGIQDFVLAHEIAHHVLDHLSREPKDLEQSREWERAADEWAIEAIVRIGELPLGGFVFCMLMLSSRGNDIVFEHLETHPADFRRMDYMLEAIVNNVRKRADKALPPGTDIDAFESQMSDVRKQFKAEFEKSVHEE